MDIVDIYGHIADKSELIAGVGNYNNIHGLLTYFSNEDLLQMRSLPEIATPSVIQLILTYENPMVAASDDKVYFSLNVKGTNRYVNVKIETDGERKLATACISQEKGYFWIDYSIVDKTPRSKLLAGALYSLRTTFGEQDYVVSWKIQGFSHGDLVIFLPLSWYETVTGAFCENKSGLITLVESLNQLKFKGYTTQQWCEDAPHITNCPDGKMCGECMGQCHDLNHICYPDGKRFVCGGPDNEPKMNQSSLVSFADSTPPSTTGTTATWIAVIAIVIIVALLAWGLARRVDKS
jgi:hypothetical protein